MGAFEGKGTVFSMGDGAAIEVFTAVASVLSIGEIGVSRETIDVTTFDSADDYKQYIGSKLKDAGEFTLELLWDSADAQQTALEAKINDVLASNYTIDWSNDGATKASFSAVVTSYSKATPMEDKVSQSFNFKLSGKPVFV